MKKINTKEFESTCAVFIDAVHKYFNHLGAFTTESVPKSETGIPYIKEQDELALMDYTGMIGISGNRKGYIYFSASEAVYKSLLKILLKIDNPGDDHVVDMVGEVSNVIAGNVKETYGNDFMISVPIVVKGNSDSLKFPKNVPAFVVPIKWGSEKANLVIGLE